MMGIKWTTRKRCRDTYKCRCRGSSVHGRLGRWVGGRFYVIGVSLKSLLLADWVGTRVWMVKKKVCEREAFWCYAVWNPIPSDLFKPFFSRESARSSPLFFSERRCFIKMLYIMPRRAVKQAIGIPMSASTEKLLSTRFQITAGKLIKGHLSNQKLQLNRTATRRRILP